MIQSYEPRPSVNFRIVVTCETPRWPTRWGPFGGRRKIVLSVRSADVEIHQKDGRLFVSDPITVDCHAGSEQLTTTVDFREGSRLKRKTRAAKE